MSQKQKETCASRILSVAARERFLNMHRRADELALEAAKLRAAAWADYRRHTGIPKGVRVGQYA